MSKSKRRTTKRPQTHGKPYVVPVESKSDEGIGLLIRGGPTLPDGRPATNLWLEAPKDVPLTTVFEAVERARRAFAIRRLRARGLL